MKFLKPLKDYISLKIKLLIGINHTRTGSCKQCGECCRTITLKIKDDFITEIKQFESLKRWQKHYNHFFISGKDKEGILLFTCKSLSDDNKCMAYWYRSLFCRAYPFPKTGETIEGCGYTFEKLN